MSLLARAKQGDAVALEALMGRHLARLQRWASGRVPAAARGLLDTDAVVQDALLNTFRRLDQFVPRHDGRDRPTMEPRRGAPRASARRASTSAATCIGSACTSPARLRAAYRCRSRDTAGAVVPPPVESARERADHRDGRRHDPGPDRRQRGGDRDARRDDARSRSALRAAVPGPNARACQPTISRSRRRSATVTCQVGPSASRVQCGSCTPMPLRPVGPSPAV